MGLCILIRLIDWASFAWYFWLPAAAPADSWDSPAHVGFWLLNRCSWSGWLFIWLSACSPLAFCHWFSAFALFLFGLLVSCFKLELPAPGLIGSSGLATEMCSERQQLFYNRPPTPNRVINCYFGLRMYAEREKGNRNDNIAADPLTAINKIFIRNKINKILFLKYVFIKLSTISWHDVIFFVCYVGLLQWKIKFISVQSAVPVPLWRR